MPLEAVSILSVESCSVKLNLKIATGFDKINTNDIIAKLNDPSLGDNIGIIVIDLFTEFISRSSELKPTYSFSVPSLSVTKRDDRKEQRHRINRETNLSSGSLIQQDSKKSNINTNKYFIRQNSSYKFE